MSSQHYSQRCRSFFSQFIVVVTHSRSQHRMYVSRWLARVRRFRHVSILVMSSQHYSQRSLSFFFLSRTFGPSSVDDTSAYLSSSSRILTILIDNATKVQVVARLFLVHRCFVVTIIVGITRRMHRASFITQPSCGDVR